MTFRVCAFFLYFVFIIIYLFIYLFILFYFILFFLGGGGNIGPRQIFQFRDFLIRVCSLKRSDLSDWRVCMTFVERRSASSPTQR